MLEGLHPCRVRAFHYVFFVHILLIITVCILKQEVRRTLAYWIMREVLDCLKEPIFLCELDLEVNFAFELLIREWTFFLLCHTKLGLNLREGLWH